ncbi:MAG: heme exporter protein CcmD [Methyloceanibacter sp.]|uniref:heme exporter protein CcmD n=1 Tax=Methyloceanibacter sp. TaxID=1965321 RepID=UPI003D6D4908
MFDLGPHAVFIVAAYGVTFVALGALTLATIMDDREQRRMLSELERKGIRRRSAANETLKRKPNAPRAKAKRS